MAIRFPSAVAARLKRQSSKIFRAMLIASAGASFGLWTVRQMEQSWVGLRELTWLLTITNIVGWPAYLAGRGRGRASKLLDALEQQPRAGQYESGYADGYLDALTSAPTVPIRR